MENISAEVLEAREKLKAKIGNAKIGGKGTKLV